MASSRSLFLLMFLVPPLIPRSRLSLESSPIICQTGLPSSSTIESQVVNKRRNKMSNELSTGKTIIIMSIVIGCFAILWPMIFYPMLQAAFNLNSVPASRRSLHERRGGMHPAMMHPRMREAMSQDHVGRLPPAAPLKTQMSMSPDGTTGRLPVQAAKATGPSSVGTMGMIMPIYSIVIVLFFIYTMFKLLTRNNDEEESSEGRNDSRPGNCNSGEVPASVTDRFPFLVPRVPVSLSRKTSSRRQFDQHSPMYLAASTAFREFQLIKKMYGLDRQLRPKGRTRHPQTASVPCSSPSCNSSSCRVSDSLRSHSVSCSQLTSLLSSSISYKEERSHLHTLTHRSLLGGKNVDKENSSLQQLKQETFLRRRAFSL